MDIVWQAEDSLQEKKVESDLKDILKTMVAFANSVAPGDTAHILVGEKDDGTVQGVGNPDNIQKKIKTIADGIYPEIYYRTRVYERDGKQCVRVEIKHNGLAPHFGGPAWIRKGSQTIKATEELYQQMVDQRQSKIGLLLQWVNRNITVSWENMKVEFRGHSLYNLKANEATLVVANAHWVTFRLHLEGEGLDFSEPIEKVLLSWDDTQGHLKILIANNK